jgi:hypothetical protein
MADKKSTGASQKILDSIKTLTTKVEESDESVKTQLIIINETLKELTVKVEALEKTKTSTRKKAAPAQTPTGPKKYTNKMLFVKAQWVEHRQEWIDKFFTADYEMDGELENVEQAMQTDKNKKKTGDAKSRAEATYIWNTYLRGKNAKKKFLAGVVKAFEEYNSAIDGTDSSKTAEAEEDESEDGSASVAATEEETADGDEEDTATGDDDESSSTPRKKTTKRASSKTKKVTRKKTTARTKK